ncbi:MAG TPA: glycosyltransferase [Terriglobales bacterium]|nr:glycosyltransferase [Terriglobales bacterium]
MTPQNTRVSIIIPARNEEATLGACLESLVGQQGVPFEIIVVDDGSTDGTSGIADLFANVRLLAAGEPPAGQSGKCHAAWRGAQAATGSWLLFTDADTVHQPGSLARCLREAQDFGVVLLSLSPEQELHGWLQRVAMPVIFGELAHSYRPADVNDPASPIAAANGQYLLIRRDVYQKVGGHCAVAHTLLEDVALAEAVKRDGWKIRFRYGGDAVRTRMYRTWPELREGWSKNLALLFPGAERLAARRALEGLGIVAGIGSLAGGLIARDRLPAIAGLAMAAPLGFLFYRRVRAAHSGALNTLLSPLGIPIFSYLLLRSAWKHRRGTVSWKGRTYDPRRPKSEGAPKAEPAAR